MDLSAVNPALRAATAKAPAVNIENDAMRWFAATASALMPGKRVDGVQRRTLRHDGVRLRVYVPARPSGAACCGSTAAGSCWAPPPWMTCTAVRRPATPG